MTITAMNTNQTTVWQPFYPLPVNEAGAANSSGTPFQVAEKSLWFVVGEQLVGPLMERSVALIGNSYSWLDKTITGFSPFLGAEAATICKGSNDWNLNLYRAQKSHFEGNYEKAVTMFTEMLKCRMAVHPQQVATVLHLRARSYNAQGKIVEATRDRLEAGSVFQQKKKWLANKTTETN